MKLSTEELVKRVKDCGEALINNAESIVGNFQHGTELTIWCHVDATDAPPTIEYGRTIIPEKFVERSARYE